jgi:RNA polymerase sigma-70 factor (ECF subfamily)
MNNQKFKEEIISMQSKLNNFALTLTNDVEDANDLVQDTYLKVLLSKNQYKENTNLKAWMWTIMRNTFINEYRKRNREREVICDNMDIYSLGTYSVHSSDNADTNYYIKEINNYIDEIEDGQRIPFEMFLDGYKYKEIADKMNISLGTVKSRIFFTRKKLQHKLVDYID